MFQKKILLCHLLLLMACSGCGAKEVEAENPFKIDTSDYKLLRQSTEDYNSIEVYQLDGEIVVNARSEAAFFDGAQFTATTENELSADNVEITWTTIGGGTEKTEHNARIIAEIIIQEDETVILDEKVNFMKKGFDAVGDAMKNSMK
ncbi:hypothetical protein CLNEO_17590 [Anaerotignum neopropionicum]|uniref:Uncharacterized protein n=1 Tax=Anaerotignum neopropionicum TaxID=36847 RepID=A0A136WDZ2_9FIRM|nr:hypothetical protein [Anaerotignum neopropionicum]KXL52737.1 hypothetical protein CLNEO_17590 [Anaerotignum neopropionicum]